MSNAPTRALLAGLALTAANLSARAQIFNVTAGASDLYGSEGITVRSEEESFRTAASLGYSDGFKVGGSAEKDLGSKITVRAGDSVIPFRLPTDVFDQGHVLLRRGLGASYHTSSTSLDAFAGGGAANYVVPYLAYASIDHSLGMLFLGHAITPRVEAGTYLVSLGQTTAIQTLSWRPKPSLALGLAFGIGSDHPFTALSLDLVQASWSVVASYTAQDGRFHRLSVDPSDASEVVGPNVQAYRRWKHFRLDGSQREYQAIPELNDPGQRGTVSEAGIGATYAGTDVDARIFRTSALGIDRENTSFSLSSSYRSLRSMAAYFDGRAVGSSANAAAVPGEHSLSLTEYVRAARRLELNGTFSLDDGQRSIAGGGRFTSNFLDLSLSQQSYFVPFASQQQFRQVWVMSLQIHGIGNTSVELDDQLGSDDKVHYTAYAGDYLYRRGTLWHTGSGSSLKAAKYGIEGCVHTRSGLPVAGAAVAVAFGSKPGEEVYADMEGCFLFEASRAGKYLVTVMPADFTAAGRYGNPTAAVKLELNDRTPREVVSLEVDRVETSPSS